MSGGKWQAHVPSDLDAQLAQFKREKGLEDNAEAARQLWRKGVEQWEAEKQQPDEPPAVTTALAEVGRVGLVAAAVGALMTVGIGSQEILSATMAFAVVGLVGYSGVAGFHLHNQGDE